MLYQVFRPQMGLMVAVGGRYASVTKAAAIARHYHGEVRIWGTNRVVWTSYGTIRPGMEHKVAIPAPVGQTYIPARAGVTRVPPPAPQPQPQQLHPRVLFSHANNGILAWRAN